MLGTFGYPKRHERTLITLYYTYTAGVSGLTLLGYAALNFFQIFSYALEYKDIPNYPYEYTLLFTTLVLMGLLSFYLTQSPYAAFDNKTGILRMLIICLSALFLIIVINAFISPDFAYEFPTIEIIHVLLFLVFYIFYFKHRVKKGFFTN